MSAVLCHGEAASPQQCEIKQIEGGNDSERKRKEKQKEGNRWEMERKDDK